IEANFHREVEARAGEREARRRAQARFRLGVEAGDGYAALAGEGGLLKDPRLGGRPKRVVPTAPEFHTRPPKSPRAPPPPPAPRRRPASSWPRRTPGWRIFMISSGRRTKPWRTSGGPWRSARSWPPPRRRTRASRPP